MQIESISSAAFATSTPKALAPSRVDADVASLVTPNQTANTSTLSPVNREPDVDKTVEQANQVLQPLGIQLEFSRDEDTKSLIVRVKDQTSGEVLRQIPSEAMLRLSAALGSLQGNLVNRTV